MNGGHDLGGMMGFGPVRDEAGEPAFHAAWEKRVFALTLAMGALREWELDMSRSVREQRSPAEYLGMSYYELWLAGLETLMTERGLATREEIDAGRVLRPARHVERKLTADRVAAALAKGRPCSRDVGGTSKFAVGDRVRAKAMHPRGHTRLPRYVRGKVGVVTHAHGAHVFPDANAAGEGEAPQFLYTVRFAGRELWGAEADAAVSVSVDAWESYLERA